MIEGYNLKASQPAQDFIAGSAEEEITPYPGIPLGGHGPGGRIARGTWMPLYARAFYFQDSAGHQAAMVSCELFAVSAGLRSDILRRVNMQERLDPDALILTATHTHHGPANFASAEAYNGFGGSLPNFDKNVFDYLSERISLANRGAADPKMPPLQQPLRDWLDALELGSVKPLLGLLGIYTKPDADSFPEEFRVALFDLSPVVKFASIPVEATTLVGRTIREKLGRETIVLGLANEYFGYTATCEEYRLQQYEGASTELEPNEARGIVYLLPGSFGQSGRLAIARPHLGVSASTPAIH